MKVYEFGYMTFAGKDTKTTILERFDEQERLSFDAMVRDANLKEAESGMHNHWFIREVKNV